MLVLQDTGMGFKVTHGKRKGLPEAVAKAIASDDIQNLKTSYTAGEVDDRLALLFAIKERSPESFKTLLSLGARGWPSTKDILKKAVIEKLVHIRDLIKIAEAETATENRLKPYVVALCLEILDKPKYRSFIEDGIEDCKACIAHAATAKRLNLLEGYGFLNEETIEMLAQIAAVQSPPDKKQLEYLIGIDPKVTDAAATAAASAGNVDLVRSLFDKVEDKKAVVKKFIENDRLDQAAEFIKDYDLKLTEKDISGFLPKKRARAL